MKKTVIYADENDIKKCVNVGDVFLVEETSYDPDKMILVSKVSGKGKYKPRTRAIYKNQLS